MGNELTRKAAFVEALPTVFGYIGIGAAFGIVGHSAGLSIWQILLISMLVYAGSAQFVMVTMLLAHSSLLAIVFSVFLVNARMILMSTSLTPYLKKESLPKNIWLGTLLTDESYALAMNKLNYTNRTLNFTWFNTVNLVSYLTWIGSSALGAGLGSLIADPAKFGINFAITAMFIGLLYLQIISDKSIRLKLQLLIVVFALVCTYFGLIFIPANLLVLVVTVLACGLGVLLQHADK
ncbi:AzlC family ABC transporter permease [Lactobacillus sp. ESL0791]|uniref:AzlC family ABC transporter permease n=1 Tax=Lactobacillus sp. ESL0791 TaxID=2983234 RepID=UPI0023F9BB7D|nr:AzlC family ABC transporter permease [Lactobacillus sp. ESL0791]MDF7637868.1 AzlC family ABC transporter permease [Lactobacillus sp. ESL0791]